MKTKLFLSGLFISLVMSACTNTEPKQSGEQDDFNYILEQFADLRILRYQVPGFDELSLQEKELIYYLSRGAVAGRDILWDQNGKYNLAIRKVLENIYKTYSGNRETEDFDKFVVYLKRVWFSNGIYHHYSSDKILPGFSAAYFDELIAGSSREGFPTYAGRTIEQTLEILKPVILDPNVLNKKINQSPDVDMVAESAVNFYQDVTEKEVVDYYASLKDKEDNTPVSYVPHMKHPRGHPLCCSGMGGIHGLQRHLTKEIPMI